MWTSLMRRVLRALRWSLGPSVVASLLLGSAFVAHLYWVEAVDDLCTIRSDGQGLIPLHDQFGPEVYCDPRWHVAGIFALYFAVRLFPAVLAAVAIPRLLHTWWRDRQQAETP